MINILKITEKKKVPTPKPMDFFTARKISSGINPVNTSRYDPFFKKHWVEEAVISLKIQDERISEELRAMLLEYAIKTHGGRAVSW